MKYRVFLPSNSGFPTGTPDAVLEDSPSLTDWLSQQTLGANETILVQSYDEHPRYTLAFGGAGQPLPPKPTTSPTLQSYPITHISRHKGGK